jgi:hypothetical protein
MLYLSIEGARLAASIYARSSLEAANVHEALSPGKQTSGSTDASTTHVKIIKSPPLAKRRFYRKSQMQGDRVWRSERATEDCTALFVTRRKGLLVPGSLCTA